MTFFYPPPLFPCLLTRLATDCACPQPLSNRFALTACVFVRRTQTMPLSEEGPLDVGVCVCVCVCVPWAVLSSFSQASNWICRKKHWRQVQLQWPMVCRRYCHELQGFSPIRTQISANIYKYLGMRLFVTITNQ